MKDPTVAILAGGLATRLQSITQNIPKTLIEIEREPFLVHQLRLLHQHGIRRVVVCAGHLGEKIQQTIGDGKQFDMKIRYSFDGPKLLGTGGAIRNALRLLSDPFFVLYGDSYLECDYEKIRRAFIESKKWGMMTVLRNKNRWDKSNVDFRDSKIFAYNKTNQTTNMQYIDYGLSLFQKIAWRKYPARKTFDLAQVHVELLQRDQLAAYEVFQRFYEIGSSKGLQETRAHLASKSRRAHLNP